jgi:hypothetical protein
LGRECNLLPQLAEGWWRMNGPGENESVFCRRYHIICTTEITWYCNWYQGTTHRTTTLRGCLSPGQSARRKKFSG